jgi:pyrimidine deaminase RibD-like protein
MLLTDADLNHYMHLALEEGRKALPLCEDNPPVGCVLVRDGVVVGRGHTNRPGAPHAEAMALAQMGGEGAGVVAFVTLEPCSFDGRTPSCARSMIAAGVSAVYVGILDPDPRNNGMGIALLREAGAEVHVGVLAEAVQTELESRLGQAP